MLQVIVSSILEVHGSLHLHDKCCNLWLPLVISCIGQNDWTQSRNDEFEAFSRQVRGVEGEKGTAQAESMFLLSRKMSHVHYSKHTKSSG